MIKSTKSLIDISNPAPMFTGSGLLYRSVARRMPSAASSTYRNSLVGDPNGQEVTRLRFRFRFRLRMEVKNRSRLNLSLNLTLCLKALTDEGRNNMGRFWIKVISWAIKIHREKIDSIESILLPVGLS